MGLMESLKRKPNGTRAEAMSQRMRPSYVGLLSGLLVMGVAVLATPDAQAKPMTVAVMTFDNGSADKSLDPLGKGLAAMVTTDLAAIGRFTLVERQRLADIKAELKLGKTRMMNKKTTAKVGKLVGASHLVTGAFTVAGNKMRLDCRMVEVATSKVVMTGEVSGEKDAFFELEKGLVKKLVSASGVKLKPKERHVLGKVHTADFKAFEQFSQGLGHFDAKRYDQAVVAMQAASNIDSDFKLASLSLEKYEELVAQSQNKANAASVAAVELQRLKRDKKAAKEALLVSQLAALMKRKGNKSVDGQVATHILYDMYSGSWGRTFLRHMQATSDQFAMQRTADQFAQSYWKNGKRVGKLAPYIAKLAYGTPPATAAKFNAFFSDAKKRAISDGHLWAKYLEKWHSFSGRLYLDGKARSLMAFKMAKSAKGMAAGDCYNRKPSPWQKKCIKTMDARRYKEAGKLAQRWAQFDISTQAFAQASRLGDDPAELERIAKEVKRNRDTVRALAAVPKSLKKYARSFLFADRGAAREFPKVFQSGTFDSKLTSLYQQRHKWSERTLTNHSFMLINGTPSYALHGHYYLWTGWRTDYFRSDQFRFFRDRPYHRGVAIKELPFIVFGAQPSDGFEASFKVSRTLPPAFAVAKYKKALSGWEKMDKAAQTPTVSFMFGLNDIIVTGNSDSMDQRRGTGSLPRPIKGYAVRIGQDTVKLVSFTQKFEDKKTRTQVRRLMSGEFEDKVIASWPSKGATKGEFAVKVAKRGSKVYVTVGGKTWSAKVSKAMGFTGFLFQGTGYGAVIKPSKKVL